MVVPAALASGRGVGSRGSGSGGGSGDSGSNGGRSSADDDGATIASDSYANPNLREQAVDIFRSGKSLDELDARERTVLAQAYRVPGEDLREGHARGSIVLPELAAGGIVRRPTVALIGEAGPEAVVPLDRMQPTTVNYVFNINADRGLVDVQSLREQLTEWVNVDFARGAYSM